ncbi:hypothetical protein I302_106635 [Kwoniella bestiolae CBS 10118]|uniref:Rad60/SUMO-like domain-containing protein n=1 Tax=Kwoniella bestiolae CBS 10118 TaxID=1296100 RepID=A0A1B9G0U3_9TREE|nr:hypothetical protein I302_06103 [Kwoniella bestiolae CBS 10118]OCF24642.1 hypothetical protein I302_06103 [Kwoniella bestiolae CBS 10118]
MSNCHPESFVEEVRFIIVDRSFTPAHCKPPQRTWVGCLSTYGQLEGLFQNWVDEVYPGDDYHQFHFRIGFDGQVLIGDEIPHDLGLHSPTKITVTRLIRQDLQWNDG